MRQTLVHNQCDWNWGQSKTITLSDGKGSVCIQYETGGNTGYISDLAVVPSLRGKGVGKELLQAAESDIRSNGFPFARLKVEKDKEHLIKWYRKQGWDEIRYNSGEGVGSDDEDYIHLFKQITFPRVTE